MSGVGRWQILQHHSPAGVQPGDVVRLRQQRWRVERTHHDSDICRLDLINRSGRRTFLLPFDRLDGCDRRDRPRRGSRRHAWQRVARAVASACGCRSLPSVIDAQLTIYPHQLELALALAAGARRVLVADEVGLGKTLQAGIALAELLRKDPDAAALVVVPAALVPQWQHELQERFELESRLGDRAGLDTAAREVAFGDNPWRRAGIWIATLDFLKQPQVLEAAAEPLWDLLVIDEAHSAAGASERHTAVHALACSSRRVVLLTATPHTGDEARYQRLLHIGALDGGRGSDAPIVLHHTRASVGMTTSRRIHWSRVTLTTPELHTLDALQRFEDTVMRAAGACRPAALLLLSIFRKRALSTFAALRTSLDRRLAWLEREPAVIDDSWRQQHLLFDGDDDVEDEWRGLTGNIGLDRSAEQSWLRRLRTLAAAAAARETKIARLIRRLRATRNAVVVFTEFRDSLLAIASAVAPMRPVAALHGSLRPDEQREALAMFLDGYATVLIATDVAGQGLNLQHRARWIVNFELPWNPARLEQRAGRIDRLGQQRRVHITLFVARHRADNDLLHHLAKRTLSARQSVGDVPFDWTATRSAEAVVETAIASHAAVESADSAPPAPPSRAWERPAHWLARDLLRRRALVAAAGRSRGITGRPVRVHDQRFRERSTVVVFEIPLVDARGRILEHRIVSLRCPDGAPPEAFRQLLPAWRERARAAVAARVRRLNHLVARASATEQTTIAALTMTRASTRAANLQPGLPSLPLGPRPTSLRASADADVSPLVSSGPVVAGTPRLLAIAPAEFQ